MAKMPRRRKIAKKLKELPATFNEVHVPEFATHAELLLDELKREDALAEEFYISWEGDDGSQIVLSAIKHKQELAWFRKVKTLLTELNEVLPPTTEICKALDINKTKEMYVLLDILSGNVKKTFNRLHI